MWQRNVGTGHRKNGVSALRRRLVHPLRLARCADQSRKAPTFSRLGGHIRRRQAPQSRCRFPESSSPSPNIQPKRLSLPDFLHGKVPIVNIGHKSKAHRTGFDFYEPRYDSPEFQKAFADLNELLAAKFEGNPQLEYMDLMMYGFWGEGHTNDLPNPFPDYLTAEKTFVHMTQLQIDAWKTTPLAVNTQPDISSVGNRQVQDMAVRAGCWLRSDSLIMDEPIQIEELGHRPPWVAIVMEDGENRHYVLAEFAAEEKTCLSKLSDSMLAFVGPDDEALPIDEYPHRVGGPDRSALSRERESFHALDIGTELFWPLD